MDSPSPGREPPARSRQPFPLLSHVFAGDWKASFDALWLMGPEGLFGDEPIPAGSAGFWI